MENNQEFVGVKQLGDAVGDLFKVKLDKVHQELNND